MPAPVAADHVSITAGVSARLKERVGSSWAVEVSWNASCPGARGSASWSGDLNLVDNQTRETTYMGGISGSGGRATQIVGMRRTERYVHPHMRLSCYEDATLHGSPTANTDGNTVIIPGLDSDGLGGGGSGGGGGGGGGGDPTGPLRRGGCANIISGTDAADRLTGGGAGDLVLGFRGADRLSGEAGHDCLIGGEGNDVLLGKAGADRLTGGRGVNSYDAGAGNDFVNARNRRRELVRCGKGRDRAVVDRRDRTRSCERVSRH